MSERTSRSFALEQTYVHEVYEQYYDNPRSKPWPIVQDFLEKLEPGALVCDVGCGNGKYLKVNMSIFNLGGEKSNRLSDLARQNENEVIRLDNLGLPFKDNCFDTVLSLSVVHHFATTDRRVSALREMARVLRVGGRMIITVWAMEQEHRKFESQDVLVPWKKPRLKSNCDFSSATNSEEDIENPYNSYSPPDADTHKYFRFRNTFKKRSRTVPHHRKHHRSVDPHNRKASSGSSPLSSPSETCYGFVRRALQKIAGGSRRVVANSWFLENWITCMHKQQPLHKRFDSDGCEYCECNDTVEDQPIELLRIDDEEPKQLIRRQTCPVSQMSADIDAFKSRSMNNIRAMQDSNHDCSKLSTKVQPSSQNNAESSPKSTLRKPKLVKQKKSICDEDAEEALDQPTDIKDLVRAMPDFKAGLTRYDRGSVLKQRSLNEDILSTDRLREKERLKQNIQKQTSLNEDLIFKRTHTFDSIKESFYAVTSSKGFQMFKTGLTNRLKNSTTMEKVATTSLKNGFVKIFQTWKGAELSPTNRDNENLKISNSTTTEQNEKTGERRHSKEDGSDSSKDSSLQSDTSVDSEDSFASVIFVPKSDPMSPIGVTSLSAGPTSPLLKTGCYSAPQSPRIKQSSCPTSPRVKQLPNGMHPLTKQLSSPKVRPSTELLPSVPAFFPADDRILESVKLKAVPVKVQPNRRTSSKILAQKYSVQPIPKFKKTVLNTPISKESPPEPVNVIITTTKETSPDKSPSSDDATRQDKLKKIREMLVQKTEYGVKSKSHCPIVRKPNDPHKKNQNLAKPIPKLLKLEIFNPEEDDDSDNSCVSSPDSTESINSVIGIDEVKRKFEFPEGKSRSILEAAANVTNSTDEAVQKEIRPNKLGSETFSILQRRFSSSDTTPLLDEDDCDNQFSGSRRTSNTWNEECQRHLTAFADKLSEKLMKELDEYQLTMDNIDDPYIHRLSEELHDLSILSEEIKKQNEYLTRLSTHQRKPKDNVCTQCRKKCECDRTNRVKNTRINVNSFSKNKEDQQPDEAKVANKESSSESYDSSDKGSSSNSLLSSGATSINFGGQSIASSVTVLTGSNGGSTASLISIGSKNKGTLSPGNLKKRDPSGLSDISADSWPPDEVGGEITYHRYYHVFRQGELEKLIEKYVDDLHVVSSTYEHASWCIVAEKVQIWTI